MTLTLEDNILNIWFFPFHRFQLHEPLVPTFFSNLPKDNWTIDIRSIPLRGIYNKTSFNKIPNCLYGPIVHAKVQRKTTKEWIAHCLERRFIVGKTFSEAGPIHFDMPRSSQNSEVLNVYAVLVT